MHKRITLLRRLALAATIVALVAGSVGCHTVKGMGQDVQSVGRSVENAAD